MSDYEYYETDEDGMNDASIDICSQDAVYRPENYGTDHRRIFTDSNSNGYAIDHAGLYRGKENNQNNVVAAKSEKKRGNELAHNVPGVSGYASNTKSKYKKVTLANSIES